MKICSEIDIWISGKSAALFAADFGFGTLQLLSRNVPHILASNALYNVVTSMYNKNVRTCKFFGSAWMLYVSEVSRVPYTSLSKSDKNRFGLKSHLIPSIIALAYLIDSIEVNKYGEMTMLRIFTMILTACYLISIITAVVQEIHARRVRRRNANVEKDRK